MNKNCFIYCFGVLVITIAYISILFISKLNLIETENHNREEEYCNKIIEQENYYEGRIKSLEQEIEKLYNENFEVNSILSNFYSFTPPTEEEWDLLYRVAAAEGGYKSEEGIKNIIWVIFNRVESEKFPNSILSVLNQPGQFTTVTGGRINYVNPTDKVKSFVHKAYIEYILSEEEVIDGALFFCKGTFVGREFLFQDEIGHRFFK